MSCKAAFQHLVSLQGVGLELSWGMQNISGSALFSYGSMCNITAFRNTAISVISPHWIIPSLCHQKSSGSRQLHTYCWLLEKRGAPANRTDKEAVVLINKHLQLTSFHLSYLVDSQIFELTFTSLLSLTKREKSCTPLIGQCSPLLLLPL